MPRRCWDKLEVKPRLRFNQHGPRKPTYASKRRAKPHAASMPAVSSLLVAHPSDSSELDRPEQAEMHKSKGHIHLTTKTDLRGYGHSLPLPEVIGDLRRGQCRKVVGISTRSNHVPASTSMDHGSLRMQASALPRCMRQACGPFRHSSLHIRRTHQSWTDPTMGRCASQTGTCT